MERSLRELSEQATRRGSFASVADLERAIDEFMQGWNENPKPFVWTASVEKIMEKIERARLKMEQLKPGSSLPRARKKKAIV
jgi:hypothetical protein